MVRTDMLRGLIAQHNISKKIVAKELGITRVTLNAKLRSGKFGVDEVNSLIKLLQIPENQWGKIFFDES